MYTKILTKMNAFEYIILSINHYQNEFYKMLNINSNSVEYNIQSMLAQDILHSLIFILMISIFIEPIIYLIKSTFSFAFNIFKCIFDPIVYFILLSSGYLTYLIYSLISIRQYEFAFLTYIFITFFLMIYSICKNN